MFCVGCIIGAFTNRRQISSETGLIWIPPSNEAVRDKTSAVRTDLLEMYEEVNILHDRHKSSNGNDTHSPPLRFS